jgi:hypothetical protein
MCLYTHISQTTKIVTDIQKIKENANKTLQEIEKARYKTDGVLPKSMCLDVRPNEYFLQQNQTLIAEFNKEDELIEKTQKAAFQINNILKFFHQKVTEQENLSFNILMDAENSVSYMKNANTHLNSANERSKGMEKIWVAYFLTLTAILVFYDWWTSRVVYIAD